MDSIDCRNNRLHYGVTALSTPGDTVPPSVPSVSHRRRHAPRLHPGGILGADQTSRDPSSGAAQHHTPHPHNIHPPVACRPRRLAPDRLAVAKAEFDSTLRDGTGRDAEDLGHPPSISCPRRTGWRPCGDYRPLNARTIPGRYQSHTYGTTLTTFPYAPSFLKLIS
jgi:hypothetical protein